MCVRVKRSRKCACPNPAACFELMQVRQLFDFSRHHVRRGESSYVTATGEPRALSMVNASGRHVIWHGHYHVVVGKLEHTILVMGHDVVLD